jgi:hypothetical protein
LANCARDLLYNPDLSKKKIFEVIEEEKRREVGFSPNVSIRERDNMQVKVKRQVNDLLKLKLIETLKEEKIGNLKNKSSKLFRLSISGIFYVLINWDRISMENSVSSALYKNYPDNLIFEKFLYQYFEKQSIGEIGIAHIGKCFSHA